MTTAALHQMVPSLRTGDAVGHHTLAVRAVLRGMGLESEIFVENAQPAVADQTLHVDDYVEYTRSRPAERLGVIYQMAVGSNTADLFFALPEPKIVNYHNITPPEFFAGWDDFESMRTRVGRTQMERLGRRTALALADSSFNAADLAAHGYTCPTAVVPILLDLGAFDRDVDTAEQGRLRAAKSRGGTDWLFVGRYAPNKAQHDLIKAFALYRAVHDPLARLRLVGSEGPERYVAALGELAVRAGVGDAVTFATGVSQGELAAHYQSADVYVCVSDHEGFCIPVLEAMHHGVPVVAFAAAAVPETVGDAGLLLPSKEPMTVTAAVQRVMTDERLRSQLVGAGRARLEHFTLARSRERLVDALRPLVGDAVGTGASSVWEAP